MRRRRYRTRTRPARWIRKSAHGLRGGRRGLERAGRRRHEDAGPLQGSKNVDAPPSKRRRRPKQAARRALELGSLRIRGPYSRAGAEARSPLNRQLRGTSTRGFQQTAPDGARSRELVEQMFTHARGRGHPSPPAPRSERYASGGFRKQRRFGAARGLRPVCRAEGRPEPFGRRALDHPLRGDDKRLALVARPSRFRQFFNGPPTHFRRKNSLWPVGD